jgi:hypothetical protein
MAPPLSPETRRRLERLFGPKRRAEAERLLSEDCGNNLPSCGKLDAIGMERIRFAALKVSGGRLDRLADAVRLAQIDWRDLLMNAGFGFDVRAHESWEP